MYEGQKTQSVKKHDKEVIRQAEEKCCYCKREFGLGYKKKTTDHIIPTSRGGADVAINKMKSCLTCNTMKSDLLPQELYDILKAYIKDDKVLDDVPKGAINRSKMALQTICDTLEVAIKKVSLMKSKMLIEGLSEPLPRSKPGHMSLRTLVSIESPEYKAANQLAIEVIGKEMEQERELKKEQQVMEVKENISIDYTLPAPKYGVGWTVYRPYKLGDRYCIDKTIIHSRMVTDEVLVQRDKDEAWEMAKYPVRQIIYNVKGTISPVSEEALFGTEAEAREWIQKQFFDIQVKVA